jgi:outer membrane immunogenic protein
MLRRTLFGLVSAVALITSANAADMYRAPEGVGGYKDGPAYVANTWTGFYVGVNGGYGWSAGSTDLSFTGSDNNGVDAPNVHGNKSLDPSGGFGGGQIGYNWQHDRIVFGVEADIQGAGINDNASQTLTNASGVVFSGAAKSELDWFGTVRGRLGYSFDRALVYFTGGLAFGGVKDRLSLAAIDGLPGTTVLTTKNDTQTGYVLGGGLEYALSPAWSVKAEYQYINLGSEKLSAVADGEDKNTGSVNVDHSYHTVRVGLNYHIHQDYEPLK